MLPYFDAFYHDLEEALEAGEKKYTGAERYWLGIGLIRNAIGQLRINDSVGIPDERYEVDYFRRVWPVFYSRLFLYMRLYGLELERERLGAEDWPAIIRREEQRVAAFFRTNGDFWQYYSSGAAVLDEQFTRAYSQGRVLEPLALVIDAEEATLASYRAACCLAMQGLAEWAKEERAILSSGTVSAADLGYTFEGSDAHLAEWLSGLQAVGAIHYQGQPADLSRVLKWARLAVGRTVANIYDRVRVMRGRKKERLPFTKKTMMALEKKWDEAEGKFE